MLSMEPVGRVCEARQVSGRVLDSWEIVRPALSWFRPRPDVSKSRAGERWMGRSTGRARAGHSRRACWGSFGLRAALSVVLLMTWNDSASFAEDATKVVRIGVLASAQEHPIQSFKERLRELGWIEGKNVQFDYRWAEAMTLANPR